MTADEAYRWLLGDATDFADHVLAAILAVSVADAEAGGISLAAAAGIDTTDALVARFPQAAAVLASGAAPVRGGDEACLMDLLCRGATTGSPFEMLLAGMVARRAQAPHHLWQDLGLANRGELSRLMREWFAPLARRNTQDMKWKKFFSRMICRDAAYALCTAPSCGECDDFDSCFGEEDGESLLAQLRRAAAP
jgi:nitrogen fixation protein NifQ